MSLYPASSDGYIGSSIGRLQYKCAARLIATIIGYSSGNTNSKKFVPTPRTCTLAMSNCIALLLMHGQCNLALSHPSPFKCKNSVTDAAILTWLWLWITCRKQCLAIIEYTICGLVALRAWPGFHM